MRGAGEPGLRGPKPLLEHVADDLKCPTGDLPSGRYEARTLTPAELTTGVAS